jgi:hypothetical protein
MSLTIALALAELIRNRPDPIVAVISQTAMPAPQRRKADSTTSQICRRTSATSAV